MGHSDDDDDESASSSSSSSSSSLDAMDYTPSEHHANNDNTKTMNAPTSDSKIARQLKRRLSGGGNRKKEAMKGIQGQALDRIGLREQVLLNGNFAKLIGAWSRKLVDLGDSAMESFAPPLTFASSAVLQRTSLQLLTWSGDQYVHVPPNAYAFAQQPRDLQRDDDLTAGFPVVPGLTVTVVQLVGKPNAPATKSFFSRADDKANKGDRSKPFKLTRGSERALSLVPPADRLVELANQAAAVGTATIVFPKQALAEGEFITQDTIRSQGGAVVLIFRPERLAWIVFIDFAPLSAAFFQSTPQPTRKVDPPADAPSKPASSSSSSSSSSQLQTEGSHLAYRGYSNIHSSSYQPWSHGNSEAASSHILSAALGDDAAKAERSVEKVRQDLATLELASKEDAKKATTAKVVASPVTPAIVDAPRNDAPLLEFALENASLAKELSGFLSYEHNAMWVKQATSAAMAMVSGIYRRNLVSVMLHRTVSEQAATILWIATVVRMSTRSIMENIGKGLYHDMPLVNPQVRQFILDHHTPQAMRLTATTLLNTSILLRWSNLERCKQLHAIDVKRGIPCQNEVLTRRDNSLGKYSSYAFSMDPASALRVVKQKNPIMGRGWQETRARDITRFIDDMLAQIYIHLAGVEDDAYRVSRPFALLLRAKIYAWMSEQHYALSAADTLFGIHTVTYLNLVMTACAYELMILSGVPAGKANEIIDASDRVDTEPAMILLTERIRQMGIGANSSNSNSPLRTRRSAVFDSDDMDYVAA